MERIAAWLTAIGAGIVALFAALGMAKRAGKQEARAEQAEKSVEQGRTADEIRNNVRDVPDSELADRLRKYQRD